MLSGDTTDFSVYYEEITKKAQALAAAWFATSTTTTTTTTKKCPPGVSECRKMEELEEGLSGQNGNSNGLSGLLQKMSRWLNGEINWALGEGEEIWKLGGGGKEVSGIEKLRVGKSSPTDRILEHLSVSGPDSPDSVVKGQKFTINSKGQVKFTSQNADEGKQKVDPASSGSPLENLHDYLKHTRRGPTPDELTRSLETEADHEVDETLKEEEKEEEILQELLSNSPKSLAEKDRALAEKDRSSLAAENDRSLADAEQEAIKADILSELDTASDLASELGVSVATTTQNPMANLTQFLNPESNIFTDTFPSTCTVSAPLFMNYTKFSKISLGRAADWLARDEDVRGPDVVAGQDGRYFASISL